MLEWTKEKFGIVTAGDLSSYTQTLRFAWLYEQKHMTDRGFQRKEQRILKKIFAEYYRDEPFLDSMVTLFMFSPVFKEIVTSTIRSLVEKYGPRGPWIVGEAARLIAFRSSPRRDDILITIKDSRGAVRLMRRLPVAYPDGETHTIDEGWNRFYSLLGRLAFSGLTA